MSRIGLFSGTFDPFHVGHLEACLVAKAACELDKVIVLIEKHPARKTTIATYEQRRTMVELAIKLHPSIVLEELGQDNITVNNTLPWLEKTYPDDDMSYIIGSDMLEHVDSWPNVATMFSHMSLCVILRRNQDEPVVKRRLDDLINKFPELKYNILPEVWSEVSSSKVRLELEQTGKSAHVSEEVLAYIRQREIY